MSFLFPPFSSILFFLFLPALQFLELSAPPSPPCPPQLHVFSREGGRGYFIPVAGPTD